MHRIVYSLDQIRMKLHVTDTRQPSDSISHSLQTVRIAVCRRHRDLKLRAERIHTKQRLLRTIISGQLLPTRHDLLGRRIAHIGHIRSLAPIIPHRQHLTFRSAIGHNDYKSHLLAYVMTDTSRRQTQQSRQPKNDQHKRHADSSCQLSASYRDSTPSFISAHTLQ